MKKLLSIICILLVIFIGMYLYKINISKSTVNASEVQKIEEYLSKIYMWEEITKEALPKFDDINNAPDLWVWEVVKKNLEKYELTYLEIQEKSIEMFGDDFTKKFPKEGTEYINYDEQIDRYITTGIGLDTLEDLFLIKDIKKSKNKYEVKIIEYLEDYSNSIDESGELLEEYDISIKNLNDETILTVKSTDDETKIIDKIKESINKFTTKKLTLKKDEKERLYVIKVE